MKTARRGFAWKGRLVLAAAAVGLAVACGLLFRVPAFYAEGLSAIEAASPAETEQLARRMVTKASAVHAAVNRPGRWELAVSDREVNAWLAVDMPRNHRSLLPGAVSDPRVRFGRKRISAAARVGRSALSVVAWAELDVELRDANQLGIAVAAAGIGAIPLPHGPILRSFAQKVESLGMVVEFRRLDGRLVLVVYIPSTYEAGAMSYWLQSLAIDGGEVLAAGATRRPAGTAGR